ncbi:MAG: hypothetical protein A3C47_07365 [Omnitrophica bacterium RIFCSPHIGHO2_02_FULL_51_18]|nr:MAG: hypothetical protein A3C47_07365 [Omnitrophica bacterium RIFCSPHIGHO2_02_FULL_51_18]
MKFFKLPQQLVSLFILFFIIIVVFIIARRIFVPATFGVYGHYRASAIDTVKEQKINYAGAKACYECHDDIFETKSKSYHKDVSCEVCHGPSAKHVESGGDFAPEIPRQRDFCPVCHGYNPSRPTGFPQVIVAQHNPGKACISCHKPHDPTPPHTPESCSACHREIFSRKMVSHHYSLACTTCHTVPDEHLANPRLNQVGKPAAKEVCGQCHDKAAESDKEIPRVDIQTHGGRYLCWDCHYPHDPEVKT